MLLPEAAASEKARRLPLREILFFAFPLAFLMVDGMEQGLLSCLLALAAALLLSIMTEEDAKEQTIDIRCLVLLWAMFLSIAVFQDRALDFAHGLFGGTIFFGLLRLLLSFWLTWQSGNTGNARTLQADDSPVDEAVTTQMGYLPIFMLVFLLYLGFGTEWASLVFHQSSVLVAIMDELIEVFPGILEAAIVCWLFFTGWEIFRVCKREPFVCAFGGGDVIFLGVFAGHLGGGTLMALFFLSLIVQAILSIILTLVSKVSAI